MHKRPELCMQNAASNNMVTSFFNAAKVVLKLLF